MKTFLLRSICTLVMVACATGSAYAQGAGIPQPNFANRLSIDSPPVFLGARPGLEFSPSTTDLIAANFSAVENGNVVTLSLAPFRAANQSRPTWGFSILASSNSEKAITEIGAGYRFQWRWLLQAAYANGAERAYNGIQAQFSNENDSIAVWEGSLEDIDSTLTLYRNRVKAHQDSLITEGCQGDCRIIQTHQARLQRYGAHIDSLEAKKTELSDSIQAATARIAKAEPEKQLFRKLELSWVSLLPVPTVSYFQGFFAPDSRVTDQEHTANKTFKLNLDWRLGTYAEATISYASSRARASSMAGQELIGAESFSATALIIVPQLLGTKHYDDVYLKDKFQRGIGFGFTYSVKSCKESGEDRVNCLDEVVDDTLLGAVIDLRITPKVTPRIVIGRRTFEKKMEAEEGTDKDASFEFGVQLAISFGT